MSHPGKETRGVRVLNETTQQSQHFGGGGCIQIAGGFLRKDQIGSMTMARTMAGAAPVLRIAGAEDT